MQCGESERVGAENLFSEKGLRLSGEFLTCAVVRYICYFIIAGALRQKDEQIILVYSVGGAARYLGTTATKVRQMMGNGPLEWVQLRTNGRLLITAEKSGETEIL